MNEPTIEQRITGFLDQYTPELAAAAGACRSTLRGLFPQGYELVYDNYNALVFAFASTDRSTGAILSVAAYPRWVTLFFADGISLADPLGLLQGKGARIRSIRLQSPSDLDRSDVRALITQAIALHAEALLAAQPLQTVVKSVSAKHRSRQP